MVEANDYITEMALTELKENPSLSKYMYSICHGESFWPLWYFAMIGSTLDVVKEVYQLYPAALGKTVYRKSADRSELVCLSLLNLACDLQKSRARSDVIEYLAKQSPVEILQWKGKQHLGEIVQYKYFTSLYYGLRETKEECLPTFELISALLPPHAQQNSTSWWGPDLLLLLLNSGCDIKVLKKVRDKMVTLHDETHFRDLKEYSDEEQQTKQIDNDNDSWKYCDGAKLLKRGRQEGVFAIGNYSIFDAYNNEPLWTMDSERASVVESFLSLLGRRQEMHGNDGVRVMNSFNELIKMFVCSPPAWTASGLESILGAVTNHPTIQILYLDLPLDLCASDSQSSMAVQKALKDLLAYSVQPSSTLKSISLHIMAKPALTIQNNYDFEFIDDHQQRNQKVDTNLCRTFLQCISEGLSGHKADEFFDRSSKSEKMDLSPLHVTIRECTGVECSEIGRMVSSIRCDGIRPIHLRLNRVSLNQPWTVYSKASDLEGDRGAQFGSCQPTVEQQQKWRNCQIKSLMFSECSMTNDFLISFFENIAPNIETLRSLVLWTDLRDTGGELNITMPLIKLVQLGHLEELLIDGSKYRKLDIDIGQLCRVLRSNTSLKRLALRCHSDLQDSDRESLLGLLQNDNTTLEDVTVYNSDKNFTGYCSHEQKGHWWPHGFFPFVYVKEEDMDYANRVQYYCSLNRFGRAIARQENSRQSDNSTTSTKATIINHLIDKIETNDVSPYFTHRTYNRSQGPTEDEGEGELFRLNMIYGLLRESPGPWSSQATAHLR